DRIAFWLDFKNAYITYERSYMETLWWIIAEWWKKNLVYQDFKVRSWCTRCGTGLSSHEVALGYKSVVDTSVYIRFRLNSQDPRWKNVSILSWTTTPWTLPGNVALAIGPEMQYVRVPDPEKKGNFLVVGQENLPLLMKQGVLPKDTRASTSFPGKELIGLSYHSLFDVPTLASAASYQVYGADFVKGNEGSGIVHTAVMYGDDDYRLGKAVGLPAIHTVTEAGKFIPTLGGGLGGKYVKSKETESLLLAHLQRTGAIIREEAYEHEYPFCWRCDTPILYYARSSWWVRVNAVRRDLLKNNETINWVPSHLKRGRFGEWLKEEKDWAFSRERYWGTTLPLWRCQACGNTIAIASVAELASRALTSGNRYILMRHGEAESNAKDFISSWPEKIVSNLTERGQEQVRAAAADLNLKKEKIDLIATSDLPRTAQTAEILSRELGVSDVLADPRLREIDAGEMNGKPAKLYRSLFKTPGEKLHMGAPGGESLLKVRERVAGFFLAQEREYRNKTILVVTHADVAWMFASVMRGLSDKEIASEWQHGRGKLFGFGERRLYEAKSFPLNERGEVDLHRPYVDEIKIRCSCGGVKTRVPEVADVWFDSGAMPFAQLHYPFEGKAEIDKKKFFPADFITEAVDQTRGWFYTLLAVSTLLGKGAPYKNVISLGHVLDRNGQKMSKSKGNVVSPWAMIEKYGVDAIRWYFYTVNAPGDPKKFDERDLASKLRGFMGTLWNSYLLLGTYSAGSISLSLRSRALIDRWVLSRLSEVIGRVTEALEAYDVTSAARVIESFVIDDFSNWYLRRSRRRFQRPEKKRERTEAAQTTAFVLLTLAELTAPFAPFIAESIYQGLKKHVPALKEESVHLRPWPKPQRSLYQEKLTKDMELIRRMAADALRQRAEAGVKVRQPLAKLTIVKQEGLKRAAELLRLAQEEVNVKAITFAPKGPKGVITMLDTIVTEALRREGMAREIVRNVQELRRDLDLMPRQRVTVQCLGSEKALSILKEWEKYIRRDVNAKRLCLGGQKKKFRIERSVEFGREKLWIGINL
ncbi:MAG: class I tRNA ligase family protein, partial [Candidatus Sungbacteria bacterium]|nr:class I tRNA ligase family protein [Candidatus Sungbacteria bacterium]